MKKLFWYVLGIGLLSTLFFVPNNLFRTSTVKSEINKSETKQDDLEKLKKKFEPAKKMLLNYGVPFDPEILIQPNWKQLVAINLNQMTEMQTTLRTSDKLKGVLIADTVVIPEKSKLFGDVVIIANTIVFEGKKSSIKGLGKNIYIFPIISTGHLEKTFQDALINQGIGEKLPAVNERTTENFDFEFVKNTILEISVNGQGSEEWSRKQEELKKNKENEQNSEILSYYEGANGEQGQQGSQGNTGETGDNPLPATIVPDGSCSVESDGTNGDDGNDGSTGYIGGIGGTGGTGGTGGNIYFTIPTVSQDVYLFEAKGGKGGEGGKGGRGGYGGNGQNGSKGGDGADCPCNRGGSGNGGNGGKGGRGGKGGTGGQGGQGGRGGDGGLITVFYPAGFDTRLINPRIKGGSPGNRGDRGDGGYSGLSGFGGEKGEGASNFNCSSDYPGADGVPGGQIGTLGFGEPGEFGIEGTERGDDGDYDLIEQGGGGNCLYGETCYDIYGNPTCCPSPIVIDTAGNGFNLTNAANGVRFDLNNDGIQEQIAWTSANSDDVWLALDRNNNGTIDNGKELFGNHTPQPEPPQGEGRNGFLALAVYDKPAKGGNNDGQIDSRDTVFLRLKLWQDTNHNGVSETSELLNLSTSPIRIIELDYRESRRTDEYGNRFRYRAKVKDAQGAQVGRWAWDVFLLTQPQLIEACA